MENIGNDFTTTLAAAITSAGQVTITVASSTGAPSVNFRARIDDELILVTTVAHPTWTIERGIEGTTATTHLNGAAVPHVLTKGGLDAYGDEHFVSIFPGVELNKVRLVPATYQLNVVDELVIDGELVIEGEVNVCTN